MRRLLWSLLLVLLCYSTAWGADTGWLTFDSVVSQDITGGDAYFNSITNALSGTSSYSSVYLGVSQQSHYLRFYGLSSLSIPAGSTINGVEIRRYTASNNGWGTEDHLYLHKGGVSSGTNKASGTWSTSGSWETSGGPADLWSSGYGYSDVTSSTFGVMINVQTGGFSDNMGMSEMDIKIYYTPVATGIKAMGGTMTKTMGATVVSGMGM